MLDLAVFQEGCGLTLGLNTVVDSCLRPRNGVLWDVISNARAGYSFLILMIAFSSCKSETYTCASRGNSSVLPFSLGSPQHGFFSPALKTIVASISCFPLKIHFSAKRRQDGLVTRDWVLGTPSPLSQYYYLLTRVSIALILFAVVRSRLGSS